MNYHDHNTKYLLLRPLESKRDIEVASKELVFFFTFEGKISDFQRIIGRFPYKAFLEIKQILACPHQISHSIK